jgi:hypothetical protein
MTGPVVVWASPFHLGLFYLGTYLWAGSLVKRKAIAINHASLV